MFPRASGSPISLGALVRTSCLAAVALTLAGCGHSSTSTTPSTNYTVGGTITGLTVSSVVLANGSATVTVSADVTSWIFPNSFAAGSSYLVTIKTQPSGEQCEITSGASGTNTGNVGNVTVACGFGQWTGESGSSAINASATYGTQGAAATNTVPGARSGASSWTDSSGNLWLFGGVGYSAGGQEYLNDLWQYSPSSKQWTWVSGASVANATGTYGTQGTAAAGNVPGARYNASSWTDSSGNLWLFGGYGYAATGGVSYLNDLWRYSPSRGQWTWIGGASVANATGTYGTQGTAATGNAPGARYNDSSWTDSSGNLWLFGGYGYAATGGVGNLNDLWRYSPSSGQWTWIGGASVANATGTYGTQGTAAAGNVPGARQEASSWIDSSGNLWLFGGYGYDSTGALGRLNDLWRYSSSSGQWTWIGGEDNANAAGIYGTLGTAATTNLPTARYSASSWIDSSGNLWLFGGYGYDATGGIGSLNDLWRYNPSSAEWTWISGGNGNNTGGVYGTQGTGAAGNVPGTRYSASSWIDSSGNLWLFGGYGYDASGNVGSLNDLWQYNPSTGS